VLSIAIAALIVWSAIGVIRDSLNILLEALPRGLTLNDVKREMRAVEGVLDIHDLHIWSLGSRSRALSCHVLIDDVPPSASNVILRRVQCLLTDRFRIRHTTLQFEHLNCCAPEEVCSGHDAVTQHDHEHGHSH
jgi:cobalt-zinc-cadmium efflux system protein